MRWLVAAMALVLSASCETPRERPQREEPRTSTAWRTRCARCHGERGRGDGPDAAKLSTPPRAMDGHAWQSSVSDEEIKDLIVSGGAAEGLSNVMAPHQDLDEEPEILDQLVRDIRSFR